MQEVQKVEQQGRVFVPFCDEMAAELASIGELVPYQLEYRCLRLKDGTYEFLPVTSRRNQQAA